jgi:transcriptional regulator with PAS, ATPase and Fis domain
MSPVLLLGETGTGKEVLAHAIHAASARSAGPFVSVNIAAIPETLLEAEFFGVAPGAFTGAERKTRDGKFKLADGGTLFLDEIGDMPASLQAKLLRALQEGEIEPLGSNQIVHFDVRVVAATSRDLLQMVRDGRFREDLFYRLHVLPVRVPPLRERSSDIPALVEMLCEDLALRNDMVPPELGKGRWNCWSHRPGAAIFASCAMCWSRPPCAAMTRTSMPACWHRCCARPGWSSGSASAAPDSGAHGGVAATGDLLKPLAEQMADLETRAIRAAMQAHGGNKLAVARTLGISRAKLYDRLEKLNF